MSAVSTQNRGSVRHSVRGVMLVELVISIMVVAIAATTLLGIMTVVAAGSAEALVRSQAAAIANAYLDEATSKAYSDPDGINETGRANFDDVKDYDGLSDNGAHDQFGNPCPGLGQYQVDVSVSAGSLGGLPSADVLRVDVTVRHLSGIVVTASGYRARY
jgi:MSHA pilin protein MshD